MPARALTSSLDSFLKPARSVSHRAWQMELWSPAALVGGLGITSSDAFVLLDSAGGNPGLCRYSFLAWDPRLELTVKSGRASLVSGAQRLGFESVDPFALLQQLLRRLAPPAPRGFEALGLPLSGGAFGLISYDAARYIEKLPNLASDDLELPELSFIFPRRLLCFDHRQRMVHLFFEDGTESELKRAEDELRRAGALAVQPYPAPGIGRHGFALSAGARSNLTQSDFQAMVRQARQYILAGDIFQANLSQRLELDFSGSSLELYQALRAINPSPFAGYLNLNGWQIISSSPERLVQLRGRTAQTRPIAGTRGRGVDLQEDRSLQQELNLDPKERAEHIMLVDLERNDLGRVCSYGSVEVDELMVNEAYSHVIHIVSNVQGRLHPGKDAIDLTRAMFPGGTITGCPKVRCMEIIDELEPVRRGAYTGSFGYLGYQGDMDLNIVIRTLVRRDGPVFIQAGAGIVADSDPEREYYETLRKAEAMVRAVDLADGVRSARG